MTFYIKNGNTFRVTPENAVDIQNQLPIGNYIVQFDPQSGFYLEQTDLFEIPAKRYASNDTRALRILNTYQKRKRNTGVLLTGDKGSGKSLLAKTVSFFGLQQEIPTLIINTPYAGDTFNKFIQDISQPSVILFDEFEKVYNHDQQERLLTLFDGAFSANKLFIVTSNNKYKIDTNMINRPGRLHYMFEFGGLDADFISEYCNEHITNKSNIQSIITVSGMFNPFSFDMLKSLVDECNMYDEDAFTAINYLNLKVESGEPMEYKIKLIDPEFPDIVPLEKSIRIRPMTQQEVYVHVEINEKDKSSKFKTKKPKFILDEYGDSLYTFKISDIIEFNKSGVTYKNKDGVILVCEKNTPVTYDPFRQFAA